MSYLLYASNEMFSSTQLIRKSKEIFDKLISKEIDKAVVLRDGKPNFILMEFAQYEQIMREYMELKELSSNPKPQVTKPTTQIETQTTIQKDTKPEVIKVDFHENEKEHSTGEIKEFWN